MRPSALGPLLLAIASSAPVAASAEDLIWPTDAGRCVTSSFCEFRPDHFHSGIDISTWGKTGYRCLAVGDGELVRARISCGGYGRALYLRLADGRTVVYAHLSRFEGAVATLVQNRQDELGTSWVDLVLTPGSFPVRAGDVVAYTGQSGVGVPHLHVEIRDEEQRPLDPLTAGLAIEDSTPPRITRVAITPLSPVSSVDGRSETVILDVLPGPAPGLGRLGRPIPVEGEVGISLEIDETGDACRYRLAPRRLELREGDVSLRVVDYSRFDFAETGLLDLQIDPRFSYGKVGRFHHLWKRPGNDLSFLGEEAEEAGVLRALRVEPGDRVRRAVPGATAGRSRLPDLDSIQRPGVRSRIFTCLAHDAAGNQGAVTVELSFAAPPAVAVLQMDRVPGSPPAADSLATALSQVWVDTLVVDGGLIAPGRPLREIRLDVSWDGGETWISRPPVLPEPDLSFHARLPLRRLVPGAGALPVVLRAQPVDSLGAVGLPVCVGTDDGPDPPFVEARFEIVTVGSWVELRFGEDVPFGTLAGGWERWEGGADDGGDVLAAVLVRPWGRGVRVVTEAGPGGPREWSGAGEEWKGFDPWGRPVPLSFAIPARLAAGESKTVASDDGIARLHTGPGTFREAVVPAFRSDAPPDAGGELRPVGSLYVLETGQVPLAGSYGLEIGPPADDDGFDPGHVGIFVQDEGDFRYIGGAERTATGAWTTDTRTLLPVGLFEDSVPPSLGPVRLEDRYGRVALLLAVKDDGAGVDCDDVEVTFDGTPIPVEFDDETGDVVAWTPLRAEAGAGGSFEIRVRDRCGNSSRLLEEARFP